MPNKSIDQMVNVEFLFQMENDRKMWHLSNMLTPFSSFDLEQFIMLSDKDIFVIKQSRFIIDKKRFGQYLTAWSS